MNLDPMMIAPRYAFWRDGCKTFTQNLVEMLRRSGESITADTVSRFAQSLPMSKSDLMDVAWRDGYANTCIKKAYELAAEKTEKRLVELLDYFFVYFTNLTYCAQYMLIESIVGIFAAACEHTGQQKG